MKTDDIWRFEYGKFSVFAEAHYRETKVFFTRQNEDGSRDRFQSNHRFPFYEIKKNFQIINCDELEQLAICQGFSIAMISGDEFRNTAEKRREALRQGLLRVTAENGLTPDSISDLIDAAEIIARAPSDLF